MIIPSIVSNEELLQVIAKAVARVKEKATNFSAKVKASGNDPNVFKDLTAASRAGEISAIDKIRRDHYGNVPDEDLAGALMHKMIAYVRGELSEEEAASYDAIINEIEAIDAELTEANSNLIIIQETFAKNNWFDLQPVDEENYEE